MCTVAVEHHLMEKVSGVFIMALPAITFFHYLMLILPRIIFLVLGEGDTFGINEISGEPENKTSINFNKANGNGNVR